MQNLDAYTFDDGVRYLLEISATHLVADEKPFLLAVGGGVGSGKSYLASRLKESLKDQAALISQDDYFFDNETVNPGREAFFNWESPETLNIELLNSHINSLIAGEPIDRPIYCMETSSCMGTTKVFPAKIIILEGTHVLNPRLIKADEFKVYVDASERTRLQRKLVRDVVERKKGTEEFVRGYYEAVIKDSHRRFVEPTKNFARVLILNEA